MKVVQIIAKNVTLLHIALNVMLFIIKISMDHQVQLYLVFHALISFRRPSLCESACVKYGWGEFTGSEPYCYNGVMKPSLDG